MPESDDVSARAPDQVVGTDEQTLEQLSTPTREGDQPGGHSSSSRGVGATSLQKYLVSVGETLTPDDDSMSESDEQQKVPCDEQQKVQCLELRSEAKSARDILAMVLDDVQSRNRLSVDISRMATRVLASVRELAQKRVTPREYRDAETMTDSCDGLAPLSELRIEDEADMVQLMLLTNRVATLVAQDAGIANPATAASPATTIAESAGH